MVQQEGKSGGVLVGDSLIWQVLNEIQELATYWNPSATSSIHSLSYLGIEFSNRTNEFRPKHIQLALYFANIGSLRVSRIAHLRPRRLDNNFTAITDPIEDVITLQQNDYTTEDQHLSDRITTVTQQATLAQNALTAKVQAADALVAQLQSEQNSVNAQLQSLNYVLYGYQTQKSTGG
jgi:flagellar capping protein FliD